MPFNRIKKEDVDDVDFINSYELYSDGYGTNSVYLSTTCVSTTSGTKTVVINLASDGQGIFYSLDHPAQPGDIVWISGTSGASGDGYFTINTIVDDLTFTINETFGSSTGGNVRFQYKSGASNIGYDSRGNNIIAHNNIQDALKAIDSSVSILSTLPADSFIGNITGGSAPAANVSLLSIDSTSVIYDVVSHTFQRAALTGAVTSSLNSNATAFGALAALSVLANATNASAVPLALAGTTAFQHLRVNSAGTGLEWSVFTAGDFPAGIVPLTTLATQATDTFIANVSGSTATPIAVNLSTLAGTGLVFGTHTLDVTAGAGGSLVVTANDIQRAALTGAVTASQDSNVTSLATVLTDTFLANISGSTASPSATNISTLAGAGLVFGTHTLDVTAGAGGSIVVGANDVQRAALTGDVTASQDSNATTIAANAVTNAKLATMLTDTFKANVSGSTAVPTDVLLSTLAGAGLVFGTHTLDVTAGAGGSLIVSANDIQRAALTGAITASQDSSVTAFGVLAAKSVLANSTNSSAVPAALAGSAAFQHLRVNSANNALEWSLLTAGDFPAGIVPVTGVSPGTSGQVLMSNATPVATWTTLTGDVVVGATGVTAISSGVIVDGDINAVAAIAVSKLAAGTSGQVLMNNSTPTPTYTTISGDATLSSAGVVAVTDITGASGFVDIGSSGNIIRWATATTAPGIIQSDNITNSATAAAMTIQAANATGTTSNGGSLNLSSGSGTSSNGFIYLKPGGASFLSMNTGGVLFDSLSNGAAISHETTASVGGFNFTLQAQNAATNGGNLLLVSGSGASSAGGVYLRPGGVTGLVVTKTASFFAGASGGSAITLTPNDSGANSIQIAAGSTSFSINQADNTTNSATAATITLQAANATGTTATGGTLALTSGTGTTAAGPVLIRTGGTTRLTANATGIITIANLSTGLVHADSSGNLTSSLLVDADITTATIALTKIATQATDTFLANVSGSTASPSAINISTLAGAGLVFGTHTLDVTAGAGASLVVSANDIQRGALTGAITASQDSNTTAFGVLAAKSVLANATNASAIPAALAGSAAFQHLRVNSANTGLEWSLFTAGDFPSAVIPLTALATQATDTFVANVTAGTASPIAVNISTLAGAGLVFGSHTLDVTAGAGASLVVTANDIQRAALTGDVTASQDSNTTTIAANVVSNSKLAQMVNDTFKGNVSGSTADPSDINLSTLAGSGLGFSSHTLNVNVSTSLVISTDNVVRAALTGDITAAQDSNATAFRSFSAKSILANATNAAGVPSDLAGSAAFQHLRVNSANTGLEWSIFTAGDFPASIIPLTALATQATDTFVANVTAGTATPVAVNISTLAGAGLVFGSHTLDVTAGAGGSLIVSANDIQRAALTGAITASQDSNTTSLATVLTDTFLANVSGSTASPSATNISSLAGAGLVFGTHTLDVTAGAGASLVVSANDIQRGALTGAITASQDSNTTAFGVLAAKSVLANATNSSAVPAALAGSAAFQHLRVNSANTGLEWSLFTAGDFPAGVVPLTTLATQATDTFIANVTAGTATPVAVNLSTLAGAGIVFGTHTLDVTAGAGGSLVVTANDIQRAALTGAITASQDSNTTAFGVLAAKGVLANATNASAVPAALSGSAAFQHLRVNSANTGLEWSLFTAGDFPAAVVPLTALATQATHTFVANNTGSTATPTAITATQATAELDVFTSALKGLAPLSGGGTTNFLRADGTWAVPVAVLPSVATDTFLGNISGSPATAAAVLLSALSSTTIIYDAASHTFQEAAITGAVTSAQNSSVTAFGVLAAKSVLSNATNASAIPAALAGSAAFQHLRVNSANTGLEWSLFTSGDFPASVIPVTSLASGTAGQVLMNNSTPTPTYTTISGDSTLSSAGAMANVSLTGSGGFVSVASTGNIIRWVTATTAPGISQADNTTNSATAAAMTIQAANATGTTATGGTLALTSGTGTTAAGPVLIRTGGTTRLTANATGVITIANLSTGLVHSDGSGNLTSSLLVNADIAATGVANIAVNKLAPGTAGQLLLNNSTPAATWTTITGDVSITSAGATTVTDITGSGGFVDIASTGNVIRWATATTAPGITQTNSTAGTVGATMLIQAQNDTGTTSVGGILDLRSGTGTTNAGDVTIRNGSTVGATLSSSSSNFLIASGYNLVVTENGTKPNNNAGQGAWWVRNDTPCAPFFVDDTDVIVPIRNSTGAQTTQTTISATSTTLQFGSYVIPANTLYVGASYRLTSVFQFFRGATATALTITYTFNNGNGTDQTATVTTPTATAAYGGTINMYFTITAIGASGTFIGVLQVTGDALVTGNVMNFANTGAIDTTTNNTILLQMNMNGGVAGTSIISYYNSITQMT